MEEEVVVEEVEEKRACREVREPPPRWGALLWTDTRLWSVTRLAFELLHLAPCPVRARLVT